MTSENFTRLVMATATMNKEEIDAWGDDTDDCELWDDSASFDVPLSDSGPPQLWERDDCHRAGRNPEMADRVYEDGGYDVKPLCVGPWDEDYGDGYE